MGALRFQMSPSGALGLCCFVHIKLSKQSHILISNHFLS